MIVNFLFFSRTISGNITDPENLCGGEPLVLGYKTNSHYISLLPLEEEKEEAKEKVAQSEVAPLRLRGGGDCVMKSKKTKKKKAHSSFSTASPRTQQVVPEASSSSRGQSQFVMPPALTGCKCHLDKGLEGFKNFHTANADYLLFLLPFMFPSPFQAETLIQFFRQYLEASIQEQIEDNNLVQSVYNKWKDEGAHTCQVKQLLEKVKTWHSDIMREEDELDAKVKQPGTLNQSRQNPKDEEKKQEKEASIANKPLVPQPTGKAPPFNPAPAKSPQPAPAPAPALSPPGASIEEEYIQHLSSTPTAGSTGSTEESAVAVQVRKTLYLLDTHCNEPFRIR